MVVKIQYGGRITDALDEELFWEYGEDYIKDAVLSTATEFVFCEIATEGAAGKQDKYKYKIPANP